MSVQGTTILALTGADGNFALNNVPAGAQTLIVRRIGYRRAVATLSADATTANCPMGHDPLELEEVVVTGQATSVSSRTPRTPSRSSRTTRSTAFRSRTSRTRSRASSRARSSRRTAAHPGGGVQVQIRGSNTVNGAFLPLYVVDGVIDQQRRVFESA